MKLFKHLATILFIISLIPAKFSVGQQLQYTISGSVVDASNTSSLSGVSVDLMVSNRSVQRVTTREDGKFQFQSTKPLTFQIRINFSGYDLYSSSAMTTSSRSTDVGEIRLVRAQSPAVAPGTRPIKVRIATPNFIQQKLTSLKYLPTKGGMNLFYALNPGLKDSVEVSSDFKVRYPELPSFSSRKRRFNKQFKKDKKKNGPYIYSRAEPLNDRTGEDPVVVNSPAGTGSVLVVSPMNGWPIANASGNFFSGKTKKFVFVFFRINSNGEPEILEDRYKVYYYTENVQGNESLYNKIGNATYGYAPMKANIYLVEVYDQANQNKRVRVSDDQVDPQVFFMKGDIFNSWIKIAIQVYE